MATEAEKVFLSAYDLVFSNWTALAFALENGLGGIANVALAKKQELMEDCFEFLKLKHTKNRLVKYDEDGSLVPNVDTQYDLSDKLGDFLQARFNLDMEDESCFDVSGILLLLFHTCRAGDLGFAQDLLEQGKKAEQALRRSGKKSAVQYLDEEGRERSGSDVSSVSSSESDAMGNGDGGRSEKTGPVVDEDGFIMVNKR